MYRHKTKWRKAAFLFTAAVCGIVFSLSALASLLPAALRMGEPYLLRAVFNSPQKAWEFFVTTYNRQYNLSTSGHFSAVLKAAFAEGADLTALDDWADARRVDGEIISSTLVLDEDDESDASGRQRGGEVHIVWRSGREERCRVLFYLTETGFFLWHLPPPSCSLEEP